MDQIVPLPEPLSDPLPMFTMGPPVVWWQLALATLLAWAAWRWLIKPRPVPPRVPASGPALPVAPAPQVPRSDFVTKLFEIESLFLESKDYREGCHALAALVRTYLEKQVNQEVEALTASEMSTAFKDPRIGRFATELRDAQYARESPTRDLFRRLCREAKALFGGGEKFELRRRG
jgi:hypothetical protein